MMNLLILGAGYVGTEISKYFQKTLPKYNLHIFLKDRKSLDYHDQAALRKFIRNNDIQYIVNCSGFTGKPNVDEGELKKEECWNLNCQLPLKISRTCQLLDVNYIHISTGCVYSGYGKLFTEEDKPNFGLFNESSFYSKSKHAYELLHEYGAVLRIRMPFSDELHERSYISKILKYDNLINFRNSKTYIDDLCRFIDFLVFNGVTTNKIGLLNFVNPCAMDSGYIVDRMKAFGLNNENWKFVGMSGIDIVAPRSNCVLSTEKLETMFPHFEMESEPVAIDRALAAIRHGVA